MTPAPAESGVSGVDVEAAALAAAAAASAAALFPPALTLSVPLVVRETLETSFLLAGGPKVLETRERTAAEIGSSSADAGGGGVDDELAGTPVNGAVTGGVPGDVAVVAVVVAAAADEAAPVVVAGVELERETPERLRTAPNLEIRSPKALSMAAVAADEEEEEESVRTGAATAGEEGGGEVSVEMEIPGIDVNMEAHEKLTAGVTNSESAEHGAQYSSPDGDSAPVAKVESAAESEVAGKTSFEGFRV